MKNIIRLRFLYLAGLLASLGLAGCAVNPVTGRMNSACSVKRRRSTLAKISISQASKLKVGLM